MPKPLISIITPTFGRAEFLPAIATCVNAQAYGNVEWLVLDDSEQPSAALAALPAGAVRYVHVTDRLSIGEKRNRLVDMARGDLIAHFDDDDYYGPSYLSTMVRVLETAEADFVRLTGFFAAHLNEGQIGYYRTLVKQGAGFEFSRKGVKPAMLDETNMPHIHLAYGWAHVYRKSVWRAAPFKDINLFEDREFVRAASTKFKMKVFEDHNVHCMHSVHGRSSSRCFPQFKIPAFMVRDLAPEAIRHLARLRNIAGRKEIDQTKTVSLVTPSFQRHNDAGSRQEPRPPMLFRAVPTVAEMSYKVVRPSDFRALGPGQPVDANSLPGGLFPYCIDFVKRRRIYVSNLDIRNLSQVPFIYMHQRSKTCDLVSVPWTSGPLYSGSNGRDPIFVFSPGRCGSTLLHSIFNAAGAVSLSEPDFYTQAVIEVAKQEAQPAKRTLAATTLAKMTHDLVSAASNHEPRQLFIKLRSLCCADPALVLSGLQERPKTVFLIRQLRPWLQSMARAFALPAPTLVRNLQQAMNCLAYLSEHTDCTIVKYDDLVAKPEFAAELLQREFGLTATIKAVQSALDLDAQLGTPLARSKLKDSDTSESIVSAAEELWEQGAPRQVLARLNLGHYLSAAAN